MLELGALLAACSQADWPCKLDVEHVQPILLARHLGQEPPSMLLNPHHSGVDVDLVPDFVELANAHDVGRELGNEVDAGEGVVLAILACEQHRPATLDPRHRVIPKTHRPAYRARWPPAGARRTAALGLPRGPTADGVRLPTGARQLAGRCGAEGEGEERREKGGGGEKN